jgi:hypothetical protein
MLLKKVAIGIAAISVFAACTKGPGAGGRASIKGKIWATNLDGLFVMKDSGYIADHSVFISYGDASTQDDNTSTGIDGSYTFDYLRPGKYKIWTISKVLLGLGQLDSVVVKEVEVTGKGDVVLDDIRIYTDKN